MAKKKKTSKPRPKKVTSVRYDFNECSKYVEIKLGIDLRDVDGMFANKNKVNRKVEYKDFWHFIIGGHEIHNGCEIGLERLQPGDAEQWQIDIQNTFVDLFGEDATYWVEW